MDEVEAIQANRGFLVIIHKIGILYFPISSSKNLICIIKFKCFSYIFVISKIILYIPRILNIMMKIVLCFI